jgi:hypothetical protein
MLQGLVHLIDTPNSVQAGAVNLVWCDAGLFHWFAGLLTWMIGQRFGLGVDVSLLE